MRLSGLLVDTILRGNIKNICFTKLLSLGATIKVTKANVKNTVFSLHGTLTGRSEHFVLEVLLWQGFCCDL